MVRRSQKFLTSNIGTILTVQSKSKVTRTASLTIPNTEKQIAKIKERNN
jgi:hypothetical protein